ncbi:MAG: signal peptidase I [Planctomycetota bacterium]
MRRWLWLPLAALIVWALIGTFVLRVYPVTSESMEPVLYAGDTPDRVLVRLGGSRLARYDLVVFKGLEDGEPVIKRVVGLPGEAVQLVDGDLFIDGERVDYQAERPAWVPLFDPERHDLAEAWSAGEGALDLESAEGWQLNRAGDLVWPGPGVGRLELRWRPTLATYARDGSRPASADSGSDAKDLRVRGEVLFKTDGSLSVQVTYAGDRALLSLNGEQTTVSTDALPIAEALPERVDWGPKRSTWLPFGLLQRDGSIEGYVRGAEYADSGRGWLTPTSTSPYPGELPPGRTTLGPRVVILVDGPAELRDLRVDRDLDYASGPAFGPHGDGADVLLGPDEIFVLGDNTLHSRDSRDYGPVPLSRVLGRPLAITRPAERRRWLSEAEAQPFEEP